jgi:hypothetical protein
MWLKDPQSNYVKIKVTIWYYTQTNYSEQIQIILLLIVLM